MIPSPKPAPREKKKPKRLAVRRDSLEKECDELWSDCVKLRAGFKSELSGHTAWNDNGERIGGIQAHHRIKKPNYWLRYSLDNGICLMEFEHQEIHFEKSPKQFMDEAQEMTTPQQWDKLIDLKHDNTKPSLVSIRGDLLFTRQALIEKLMKAGDTYLMNIFLKGMKQSVVWTDCLLRRRSIEKRIHGSSQNRMSKRNRNLSENTGGYMTEQRSEKKIDELKRYDELRKTLNMSDAIKQLASEIRSEQSQSSASDELRKAVKLQREGLLILQSELASVKGELEMTKQSYRDEYEIVDRIWKALELTTVQDIPIDVQVKNMKSDNKRLRDVVEVAVKDLRSIAEYEWGTTLWKNSTRAVIASLETK